MAPVRAARPPAGRRAWLLGLAAALLAGCAAPAQRTQFDSWLSPDRTFNTVLGAMTDQKMTVSVQDRRQGLLVGELNGDTVQATVLPNRLDGTVRVQFSAVGAPHADDKLLGRVIDAYRQRMTGQANILPQRTP